ncbi:MAG: transcriptional regulator [Nostocales cyanobacterium W4_Combined_metabat2_030]|jgi:predicted HTH transcriptional regulator|nr:transcriptional regulator [Nostocales cyanobacterium W4_Combined_metabat2_030]
MELSQLSIIVQQLISLPQETEWVEFKQNNEKPEAIGEYISALSNSATLHGQNTGYLVWGIEDNTRNIVGTQFKPKQTKIGNEELENWLLRLLFPRINFKIYELTFQNQNLVLLEIPSANYQPVSFQGIALENITADEVLTKINYPSYFELTKQNLPDNKQGILERLETEKLINIKANNYYDITNLGAILFAKKLSDFERLGRKAIRVIIYKDKGRIFTQRERVFEKGYAVSYEEIIAFINDQLPENEQIGQALRQNIKMYPEIAIRELVANAMIHQDFNMTGVSSTIEIFSDRMEIRNPGEPLVDTMRFIDIPPQSRNENLAAFMRRINICEERGSGIDKVIDAVEFFQLPAPDFNVKHQHTEAVLLSYRELKDMDKSDRMRACYQHACLRFVCREQMTNESLRQRFAIDDKNYSMASRIIADTINENLIKPYDPENKSKKHAKYVPFWA